MNFSIQNFRNGDDNRISIKFLRNIKLWKGVFILPRYVDQGTILSSTILRQFEKLRSATLLSLLLTTKLCLRISINFFGNKFLKNQLDTFHLDLRFSWEMLNFLKKHLLFMPILANLLRNSVKNGFCPFKYAVISPRKSSRHTYFSKCEN